jgi:hypothetical protein
MCWDRFARRAKSFDLVSPLLARAGFSRAKSPARKIEICQAESSQVSAFKIAARK